ncbi:ABC-type lipoprotein export system ATPase subunit [Rhodoblastus acidophilus]|uniref:ATP-binding cassette domain-containing protein n=1 Tax=Rhodoblastus acidophilus TaxID=1074 RepID=UPI00222488F6|nr:ATP-binding cassette domain-containing protein [Rhodoblastus acidophilus]MCW2284545.1 ABC-type lipoprotein export system ATPase subunit [Rhodoblastus acidophilus]MCW2333498.1 ABC-type lipoprotein export system ATPase subunit [Rhodoblastus acidophilus]
MSAHMSPANLSLRLDEAQRLNPAFATLIGPTPKPDLSLADWLASLDSGDLDRLKFSRVELEAHLLALIQDAQGFRNPVTRIKSLRILGGRDKTGAAENLDLDLRPGAIVSVVGPTGSGKSRLLGDIECLAQGDTPSGRRILIDGEIPDPARRWAASGKLVAQLSQNMNFVVDLTVGDFVEMHAECRAVDNPEQAAAEVIACANQLAGEKFSAATSLTQLSGGQSRALMIADVALLSTSPIVLIDEIENAGINRRQALDLLVASDKIVLMSTHDPILALHAHKRIVIAAGAVLEVIETSDTERAHLATLEHYDRLMSELRENLRHGARLETLPLPFGSLE